MHAPLWHHTYYTSMYLIDDITGELYACHQDELIAIKEQGYLQKEIAEEKYLDSKRERRVVDLPRGNNPQLPMNITKDRPKLPLTPTPDNEGVNIDIEASESLQSKIKEQNRKTIEEATSILRDYQEETHQLAVVQWNQKRRERKQLENDLLQYQVSSVQGGYPTDQEIEQARVYLNNQHAKKLREELPYISSSLCRDPENISAIEKEYSKNREYLDYRQKRGLDLLKVAKSFTDYARRQDNLREKIRQEEIQKL